MGWPGMTPPSPPRSPLVPMRLSGEKHPPSPPTTGTRPPPGSPQGPWRRRWADGGGQIGEGLMPMQGTPATSWCRGRRWRADAGDVGEELMQGKPATSWCRGRRWHMRWALPCVRGRRRYALWVGRGLERKEGLTVVESRTRGAGDWGMERSS
jgi:hypothetical protein